MKQETTNTFEKGLMMDLHPLMTPKNVLTNCLNGTYITFNGNEIMLQNDMGNGKVERAKLPSGYMPIGIKEYGGIIYVVSYNPFTNKGQVGSFPSPEIDFDGKDLENEGVVISNTDFFDDSTYSLKTTSIKRPLNDQDIIKVGDLYQVSVIDENTDVNNILKIVNDIKDLNTSTNIKDGRKILTIRIAVIDANNNINYLTLENNDPYYENANTLSNLLGNYILPIVKSGDVDVSDYEVYTFSKNSKLLIVAELESLDSMTLDVEANSLTEYIYDFKVKINPHYFWRWLKIEYVEKLNGTSTTTTKYIRNVYAGENINNTSNLLPGVSEALNPAQIIGYSDVIMTEDDYITWQLKAEDQNTIIDYTITPYMCYGPVEQLTKRGSLNVLRYSDTYVNLTKWKYKIINNQLVIDWAIDYNSRFKEKLYRIDFKFSELNNETDPFTLTQYVGSFENNHPLYDHFLSQNYVSRFDLAGELLNTSLTINLPIVVNNRNTELPNITTDRTTPITNNRSTDTNLATRVVNKLQKHKLYLCNIIYYTIDPTAVDVSTLNQTSSLWTKWESQCECRFVYTNGVMDKYYDSNDDFNTISPEVTLQTIPYYKEKVLSSEIYDNNSIFTYTNNLLYTTQGTKTTRTYIDVNAKTIISNNFTSRLTHDNMALVVNDVNDGNLISRNSGSIPTITNRKQISASSTLGNVDKTMVRMPNIIPLTYCDSLTNTKSTLSIKKEYATTPQIDSDSVFDSTRFKLTSINKNTFSCDRELNTTTDKYAVVLKKYYVKEYYEKIFGYDPPTSIHYDEDANDDIKKKPVPNRAYTHSLAYFVEDHLLGWRYYPEHYRHLKTYVEYDISNTNVIQKNSNWSDWKALYPNESLPSVSLFGSKNKDSVHRGAEIHKSIDYLYTGRKGILQTTWKEGNWCFPLLKCSSFDYAFIYTKRNVSGDLLAWESYLPPLPSHSNIPPRVDKVKEVFIKMFDDKYLFQKTKLTNLYTPVPSSYSYNTYNVNYLMNANVIGTLIYDPIKINDFTVTESNVTNYCTAHEHQMPVNFKNVILEAQLINSSIEIPLTNTSCQFNNLINHTQNWDSNLNNTLYRLEGENLIDLTNTLDSEGNNYNVDNYYVLKDNVLLKGNGVWKTQNQSNSPNSFRELWLDTTSTTLVVPEIKFEVGKIVTVDDIDDFDANYNNYHDNNGLSKNLTQVERVIQDGWSSGGYTYQSESFHYHNLEESPYNYKIYNEPLNWD